MTPSASALRNKANLVIGSLSLTALFLGGLDLAQNEATKRARMNAIQAQTNQQQVLVVRSEDPFPGSIDVTYDAVLFGLSDYFAMSEALPPNGQPQYVGKGANGIARLEMVGPKSRLTSAALFVRPPKNAPAALAKQTDMVRDFARNTVPEWTHAHIWVKSALRRAARRPGMVVTTYGFKKICVQRVNQEENFMVLVRHR